MTFKAGDKVVSPQFGEGIVWLVQGLTPDYPIEVKFVSGGHYAFTEDGAFCKTTPAEIHLLPTEECPKKEEVMQFKVGDKVFSAKYGTGKVTDCRATGDMVVYFKHIDTLYLFDRDGKWVGDEYNLDKRITPTAEVPPKKEEGTKFDDDKPDCTLLDADFLLEMATILTHGEKKYGRDNWRLVEPKRRYQAAQWRHVLEAQRSGNIGGVMRDEEHGQSHHAAVAVNAMFLYWKEKQNEKKAAAKVVAENKEEI